MAYTTCDYMLDALSDLRQYEEQPATRQALFAAVCAFVDEHRRHSGLNPLLTQRVIDLVPDPDDEEEVNSIMAGRCKRLPPGVSETSHQASVDMANAIMDNRGLNLLKKYSEEPGSESSRSHPHQSQ